MKIKSKDPRPPGIILKRAATEATKKTGNTSMSEISICKNKQMK